LVLVALLSVGVWNVAAVAGIEIVSESAAVDRDAGMVRFSLEFSGKPDLWTMDEFGRLADSFQYEIDGDWRAPIGLPPEGVDSVVRGDEIHVADALRIREAGLGVAPDADEMAGGWGAVRAEVPFELDGTRLTFDVPLDVVGDDGDGYFAYRVFTTEYGLTTSQIETRLLPPGEEPVPGPIPVPLPAPLQAAGVAVLVLGAGRLARRLRPRLRAH
jgi:hypothetical protein